MSIKFWRPLLAPVPATGLPIKPTTTPSTHPLQGATPITTGPKQRRIIKSQSSKEPASGNGKPNLELCPFDAVAEAIGLNPDDASAESIDKATLYRAMVMTLHYPFAQSAEQRGKRDAIIALANALDGNRNETNDAPRFHRKFAEALDQGDSPEMLRAIATFVDLRLYAPDDQFVHRQPVLIHLIKAICHEQTASDASMHDALTALHTSLAKARIGVNTREPDSGATPLHWAALNGLEQQANELITAEAELNARWNTNGCTPLHHAAQMDRGNLLAALAQAGAELNSQDEHGRTPLHYAAYDEKLNAVKKLIDLGADINWLDKSGCNALHIALQAPRLGGPVIEELIRRGADITQADHAGDTPLLMAAAAGDADSIALLLKQLEPADREACNHDGENALHLAIQSQDPDAIVAVCNANIRVDQQDRQQRTPLDLLVDYPEAAAVFRAHPNLLSAAGDPLLLALLGYWGLSHARQTSIGSEALDEVIDALTILKKALPAVPMAKPSLSGTVASVLAQPTTPAHLDAIRQLISASVLSANDTIDSQPLLHQILRAFSVSGKARQAAIQHSLIALFDAALEAGADVHTTDQQGASPLHVAANIGRLEPLKRLLGHGADANAANRSGETPIHTATLHNHDSVLRILIAHGADIDQADRHGRTALHIAAQAGHLQAAEMLAVHDARLDLRDAEHCTPLHLAAMGANQNIMQLLLRLETDADAQNAQGNTALHLTADHVDATRLLLDYGANPGVKNQYGDTPIDQAKQFPDTFNLYIHKNFRRPGW